ncbi:aldehyde dehydrogenase [Alcaligenaceae bacterium CGII-47]|nr:aldehyde dehydrogenase [Alcaligenaceae bacterium CGII-47]
MKYSLFIGGEWTTQPDQHYFPAINPYSQEVWAEIPQASEAQVIDAIDSARAAFNQVWSKTSGLERGKLMNRLADLLDADAERMSILESTDNGKVIRETSTQMHMAARAYRFFAGSADKLSGKVFPLDKPNILDFAQKQALGVAVLITAWNSPIALLSNKLAPALAAGCTVIIKPSEHASVSTLEFAKFIEQAGFPKGVVNVVTGDYKVGKWLINSRRIDKISFTGSPGVGREIASDAGRNLTPVTLELGGKSPNIIFEAADINKAVVGALAGIFGATGQTCIAGSRLLVQKTVYADVVDKLVARAKSIILGDPLDFKTEMGTLANQPQFDRVMALIKKGGDDGAVLAVGGERATGAGLSKGLFIQPTIFKDVDNSMALAREEIFGPVLSIIPFDTEDSAIEIANDNDYGLAAGIWTNDLNQALRVSQAVHAGCVWVNTYRASAMQAPFGGFKDSGFGRERSLWALDEYMTYKNVMIDFSGEDRDPFAVKG